MKRPLIGVTPGYSAENNRLYIGDGYFGAVNKAGGLAVLLPLSQDMQVLAELPERCDGFLLSGGPDIDARYFGEPNLKCNGEISPLRDKLEIFIAKKALELEKPILGICRGIQVLNAALGGSLYQDIYTQINGRELLKHMQAAPGWYPIHEIRIERDAKLWKCFGREKLGVNSFHHQSVRSAGKGLRITAVSEDGIVEAIEHESRIFTVGVQWHPELMWQEDPEALKLFEALVRSAAGGEY